MGKLYVADERQAVADTALSREGSSKFRRGPSGPRFSLENIHPEKVVFYYLDIPRIDTAGSL